MTRRLGVRVMAALGLAALLLAAVPVTQASETGYDYCGAFPEAGVTLFLLDRTSMLDGEDRQRLKNGWEQFARRPIPDGTRIIVRSIADYWTTSTEMFNRCIPACPPDKVGKALGTCDRDGVAADRADFSRHLQKVITEDLPGIANAEKPESGIIDTIAQATYRYSSPETKSQLREIVIFSDFIEYHPQRKNNGGISFYHDGETALLSYLDYVRGKRQIPDLSGIKITGFGFGKALGPRISRTPPRQGHPVVTRDMTPSQWDRVYKFWILYFQRANVTSDLSLELDFGGIKPATAATMTAPVERSPELATAKKEARK